MSKRTEAIAMEAYPPTYTTVKRHAKRVQSERTDTHQPARAIFQKGYDQAEKDLALTWEDIRSIIELYERRKAEDAAFDACDYEALLYEFNYQREKK